MYSLVDVADSNKDKYKMYQKESQVISIYGTDSTVFVSVPQMLPNFYTIDMNEPQDTYYQIRSFYFKNTFSNIKVGDKLGIKITIGATPFAPANADTGDITIDFQQQALFIPTDADILWIDLSQSSTFGPNSTQYKNQANATQYLVNNLLINNSPDQLVPTYGQQNRILQGKEMVDLLNQYLATVALMYLNSQFDSAELVPIITPNQQNIVFFAMQFQFGFDDPSGKMYLQQQQQQFSQFYQSNLYTQSQAGHNYDGSQSWSVTSAAVEFFTDPTASASRQKQIAKFFGLPVAYPFSQFNDVAVTNTLTQAPQYYGTLVMDGNKSFLTLFGSITLNMRGNIEDINPVTVPQQVVAAYKKNYQFLVDPMNTENWSDPQASYIPANNGMIPNELQYVKSFGLKSMNVLAYDFIYVRTSLNTNFWDYGGAKKNIIDIVPVKVGTNAILDEHRHITRIYQSKDPNVRNFTLRFTDQDGELIEFNDAYLMNIAVFYTPTTM